MSKPIQFSMGRMFGAVTLFCVGVAALVRVSNEILSSHLEDSGAIVGIAAVGALLGSAIGIVIRRPILVAAIGAILLPVGFFVLALTFSC
jgi:hypothetical protein